MIAIAEGNSENHVLIAGALKYYFAVVFDTMLELGPFRASKGDAIAQLRDAGTLTFQDADELFTLSRFRDSLVHPREEKDIGTVLAVVQQALPVIDALTSTLTAHWEEKAES